MKMRVLYFSKAGNSQILADAVSREFKCHCDQIPPAYPVESQKLIIVGTELSGNKLDKQVIDFCKNLNSTRTKNVAFFVTANSDSVNIEELKSAVKASGINVAGNTFVAVVKSSLFSKGKVSDADINAIKTWAKNVMTAVGE